MLSAELFDTALLYILLLAAVALGWTLGYRYAQQGKKVNYPDWIPSVDYLLAESNDAALEKLIKIFFNLGKWYLLSKIDPISF